jgi:sulfatase maturation enzyme AslB (radical SAM superfamily)
MIRDPECGTCELWSICFGGCPLRAFSFSGEFYSRDYYCPVYRSMCARILAQHQREAAALKGLTQPPVLA